MTKTLHIDVEITVLHNGKRGHKRKINKFEELEGEWKRLKWFYNSLDSGYSMEMTNFGKLIHTWKADFR